MSEFNFNYKCLSLKDKDASKNDHALKFTLFQDYNSGSGEMQIQVYIPLPKKEEPKKTVGKNGESVVNEQNELVSNEAVGKNGEPVVNEQNELVSNEAEKVAAPHNNKDDIVGVRYYFEENGIDFPDKQALLKGTYVDVKKDLRLKTESCIYISSSSKNGKLSGTGLIGLIKGNQNPNDLPEDENIYKFITNFEKKEIISYRIIENKSFVRVEILYPKLCKSLKLHILAIQGRKPLFNKDNVPENYLKDDKNNVVTIELKPTNRTFDVYKKTIKTKISNLYDFRLTFDDIANNEFYVLSDESDDTLEDRKQQKDKNTNDDVKLVPEYRCPVCGHILKTTESVPASSLEDSLVFVDKVGYPVIAKPENAASSSSVYKINNKDDLEKFYKDKQPESYIIEKNNSHKNKHGVYTCDGKYICEGNSEHKDMIVCNFSGSFDEEIFSPFDDSNEYCILPDNVDKVPTVNLVVAGHEGAGKTMFLSSLINANIKLGVNDYECKSFILDTILKNFDLEARKKGISSEHIRPKTVAISGKNLTFKDSYNKKLNEDIEGLNQTLLKRYSISLNEIVEGHTPPQIAKFISYYPMCFSMNKMGNVCFYDVAGECFKLGYDKKNRAFDVADGIIALVDGGENSSDPLTNLKRVLSNIPLLTETNRDFHDVPIAVVFTKMDLKLSCNVKKDDEVKLGKCFDENCHIVRENMFNLFSKKCRYHNSDLERHIDCSSYEIEHYIESLKKEGDTDIKSTLANYKNIKYFACSSIGSEECLGNNNEVLFKPKRVRLELPIIWLMYKTGMIKR